LNISRYLNSFKTALESSENKQQFFNANLAQLKEALESMYGNYDFQVDSTLLTKMLADASKFTSDQSVTVIESLSKRNKSAQNFVKETLHKTQLKNQQFVFDQLLSSADKFLKYSDDLMRFQEALQNQQLALKPEHDRREGVLNKLMGDYVA